MPSRIIAASLALSLAFIVLAQEPEPIRVRVNEVILPVTVTDDKGRFVTNLDQKDFHIFDEGNPQKISYFTRDHNQPVVVGFLIDMSNGMKIHWKKYQEAITELVQNLVPGDSKYSGFLITYGNLAQLEVDTTSDSESMVTKLGKMKPAGGSALFDAVWAACTNRKLVKGEPYEPRRVLVVVGDVHDTVSSRTLDQVVEIAQKKLVTVYGMSTVAFGLRSDGEENLRKLCEETGGRVESPLTDGIYKDVSGYLSKPSDAGNYVYTVETGGYAGAIASSIYKTVANIAGEITTQYIIRYTPDSPTAAIDKPFHNLRVQVDLPGVKVRYRKGYYR